MENIMKILFMLSGQTPPSFFPRLSDLTLDRLFVKLQELKVHSIDEEFFVEFASTHPAMLYPAIVFQNILKEKIIGEKFWVKQMNWRDVTFKKYRPITFIINFNDMMNQGDQFKKMSVQSSVPPFTVLVLLSYLVDLVT
jgi:hypothetical protein